MLMKSVIEQGRFSMNQRDERGWRIPRKGTKSWEIYHLLVNGWKPKEIMDLFQEERNFTSIGVLICHIKSPEKQNALSNNWWREHPDKRSVQKPSRGKYSKYVKKLVTVLKISHTEAKEIERKELEKVK